MMQTRGAGLVRVVPHPHPRRVEGGDPTAIQIPTQVGNIRVADPRVKIDWIRIRLSKQHEF